jgi:hypothetical protein
MKPYLQQIDQQAESGARMNRFLGVLVELGFRC